jgi:hypothetical protein
MSLLDAQFKHAHWQTTIYEEKRRSYENME